MVFEAFTIKRAGFALAVGLCAGCATTPQALAPMTQPPKAQVEAAAPAPAATATSPPAQTNREAVRRTLLGADLAFSRSCEQKGASDAFYEFMAPDGVCLLAGELPIQGRDTVKLHLSSQPQGNWTWKPSEAEAGGDGEMGYTWGSYEYRGPNKDGQTQTTFGKYVILWKKQPDTSWKADLYATSPSPPPISRR
jgi:ketosteroid isomerase-like protein